MTLKVVRLNLATSGDYSCTLFLQFVDHILRKTNILPKTNSNTKRGCYIILFLLLLSFKESEEVQGTGSRYNCVNWLAQLNRSSGPLCIMQWAGENCADGNLPFAQWVLENYILLPKGYSQKLQHNFPRFLKLFSNFVYLITTHTADRSMVLAQKHPNLT